MIPYVLTEWKHSDVFKRVFKRAAEVAECAPDKDNYGKLTRCHEVVRAAFHLIHESQPAELQITIVDGKYLDRFEHSWLGLKVEHETAVLDVYAVGSYPPTRLTSTSMGLCQEYRPNPLGQLRDDIDENHVAAIVSAWQKIHRGGYGPYKGRK